MRLSFVAALSVLAVGGGIAASPASALTGPQEIAALNAQRLANALPSDIVEIPQWSTDCAAHMNYLRATGKFQHHEDATDPQYTLAGHTAGTTAVLTSGGGSFSATGANAFEHAPIHLMQMLSPFLKQSGAAAGCLATLRDLGVKTQRQFANTAPAPAATFSYPGDSVREVPVSEKAYESPFVPGDFVGLPMGTTTGPHLYFFSTAPGVNGYFGAKGAITSASLVGPAGPVEVRTVDNATPAKDFGGQSYKIGDYLAPGGIVIPVQPLATGTDYTATVAFQPTVGAAMTRTWAFTTAGPRQPIVTPPAVQPPAAAPAPAPTPAPPAAPADTTPVVLTQVKLKAHTLAVRASRNAPLWITIEAGRTTGKGKKRRTTWKFRESLSVDVKMGAANSFTHRKLAKGEYRLTFRLGRAKGPVQLTKTTKLR